MRRSRWHGLWLGLTPALFIAGMAVLPMLRLMWFGASEPSPLGTESGGFLSGWLAIWSDSYLRERIVWSLTQAGVSTVLAVLLGVPVAWVMARLEFWGRQWLMQTLMLPFVVPTLVAAMGVLAWWGAARFGGAVF